MPGKIPFTQYLLPDGRRRDTFIEMEDPIFQAAAKLIEKGYRFECEVLTTSDVVLTCVDPLNTGDIAMIICKNGPDVPPAVAELVKQATQFDETGVSLIDDDH